MFTDSLSKMNPFSFYLSRSKSSQFIVKVPKFQNWDIDFKKSEMLTRDKGDTNRKYMCVCSHFCVNKMERQICALSMSHLPPGKLAG